MKILATALFAALLMTVPAAAQNERFTLEARDVDLADVIRLLGARSGQNVVADGSVKPQRVTLRLKSVTFDEALATLLSAYALQTHRDGRVVIVGDAASMNRRFPDDATPGGTQTAVFALAHARPDDVATSLQTALAQGTVVVGDKRTGALVVTGSPSTVARARRLVAALDAPGFGTGGSIATASIPLHNLRASDAVKTLRAAVPENTLFADDRQNVVVVSGNSELQTTVRTLLHDLDAPGRQVMIEVRVADVQPINDTTNVGVQLGGTGYGSGALAQFPYALTKSSLVVNAQIDALIQRGRASILAQPRIATLNNREASLLDRRAVSGRHRESADGISVRADDRRRRAPTPHADDRRRRHDHGRPASGVQSDHRVQQQLPDRREPQGRRNAARARRRDHRARRPVPRRRLRDGDEVPHPRRSAGSGRLLPQPPDDAQQGRSRLLHHAARPGRGHEDRTLTRRTTAAMKRRRSRRRRSGRSAFPIVALLLASAVVAVAVFLIVRGDTSSRGLRAVHSRQRAHDVASAQAPAASAAPSPTSTPSDATASGSALAEPSEAPEATTPAPGTASAAPTATPRAGAPRLAIIIDDCGQWPDTEHGFIALPAALTLSVCRTCATARRSRTTRTPPAKA